MKPKKASKIKIIYNKNKRIFERNFRVISLGLFLILFPLIVALCYRIPIHFVDIPIGDLLSFYAVALGLFATYLTYRETEKQKSLSRQESLRPKMDLDLEFDNDEMNTKITLKNLTDCDYTIVYIVHEYADEKINKILNAKQSLVISLECWDEQIPECVYVDARDQDGNNWTMAFEYQEGSNKYCRVFVDPV